MHVCVRDRESHISPTSGAVTLILAPRDITVRSRKERVAAEREVKITKSKRHDHHNWQGG